MQWFFDFDFEDSVLSTQIICLLRRLSGSYDGHSWPSFPAHGRSRLPIQLFSKQGYLVLGPLAPINFREDFCQLLCPRWIQLLDPVDLA